MEQPHHVAGDAGATPASLAIRTDGLTKQYGEGSDGVLAVDHLDLDVGTGEIFGFLGPNGAGKSTTIDMLLDYIRPTAGGAEVLGMDPRRDAEELRHHIGVVPEGYGLYERLTGRRHLEFAIEWKDADDEPDALIDRVGLEATDAARPVGDYSKGMRQRLALAMALVGEPDLLILDEPSSGLDPHGIRLLRDIVREEASRGATVFFSSHILDQVEAVCDRVAILVDGRLVGIDTIDGLRRAIGQSSTVKLRIDGHLDADPEAVPGVESARWQGDRLVVSCARPSAKARLITRLTTRGVDIADIEVETPSLEDVFTAYTTEHEPVEADQEALLAMTGGGR